MFDQLPFGGGISVAIKPGSIAANGRWANMKHCTKAMNIIVVAGVTGTLVVALEQATDGSGTGAKALKIERLARKKDNPTNDIWTSYSSITNEAPVANWSSAVGTTDEPSTAAAGEDLLLIEVRPSDLDMVNGYCFVRVVPSGAGAATGVALYLPTGWAYKGDGAYGVLATA